MAFCAGAWEETDAVARRTGKGRVERERGERNRRSRGKENGKKRDGERGREMRGGGRERAEEEWVKNDQEKQCCVPERTQIGTLSSKRFQLGGGDRSDCWVTLELSEHKLGVRNNFICQAQ
jgi:hypothetical protein